MAEHHTCTEGDHEIVLKRKPKKRYLSVLHKGQDLEAFESISRRCRELFGYMTLEKAGLRLVHSEDDVIIVRVRLPQIHAVLVSIALADPPMVTIDMSGSISRLRTKLHA